jgi:hypothetical protein
MAVLTIVVKEERATADLDIGSAYLEAKQLGKLLFIIIDMYNTPLFLKKTIELKKFVRADGTMRMRLNKALYGCVISATL